MKKLIYLFAISVTCFAEPKFFINFSNIQSIQGLECKGGKSFVLVEIDDTVQPVRLYKIENNKQVPVTCNTKEIK